MGNQMNKVEEYKSKINYDVWEDVITLRTSSEEKVLRSKLISELKKYEMKETKDNVENKN
jgi:hypothetical protein|tara:strand:+ start:1761 stop:1940 length:180 start_codon:yes stop_codon:yes gene_type:complete